MFQKEKTRETKVLYEEIKMLAFLEYKQSLIYQWLLVIHCYFPYYEYEHTKDKGKS
jgi:hypothetical protein